MHNELLIKKSWWKRNWKWFLPTAILLFSLFFGSILTATFNGSVTDVAKAYADNSLYEKAIEKAQANQRVIEAIGKIDPLDKLAIMEGNTVYSNNYTTVTSTVKIKGNKGKGKIDITAAKNGATWEYQKISLRIKNSKEEIQILNDTTQK